MTRDFRVRLEDLERSARVAPEHQLETQEVERFREYLDPEELDRMRLLADPAGGGRLSPRG